MDNIIILLESLYYTNFSDKSNIILILLDLIINSISKLSDLDAGLYLYQEYAGLNYYFEYRSGYLESGTNFYHFQEQFQLQKDYQLQVFDNLSIKRSKITMKFIKKHIKQLKNKKIEDIYDKFIEEGIPAIQSSNSIFTDITKYIKKIYWSEEEENLLRDDEDRTDVSISFYYDLHPIMLDTKYGEQNGLRYPSSDIFNIIQHYNSDNLRYNLKLINKLLEKLKNSQDIYEFVKIYDELSLIIQKLPRIINSSELRFLDKYHNMYVNLLDQRDVIYYDYNSPDPIGVNYINLFIETDIRDIKKKMHDYFYIFEFIRIKIHLDEMDFKICHSLEPIKLEFQNNEFDFEIHSISLLKIVETINSETGNNFILTDEISENIKIKYFEEFDNYDWINIFEDKYIYPNRYDVYEFLKYKLITSFITKKYVN